MVIVVQLVYNVGGILANTIAAVLRDDHRMLYCEALSDQVSILSRHDPYTD